MLILSLRSAKLPAKSHSRRAKDTKQINKNNCFDWFIQNINTIALVEGI
jgi:hypothetical protein